MKIKRPAILFLSASIIGILIAYSSIPYLFKILIVAIAIFLYLKLVVEKKLYIRTFLIIILFFIIGFVRFKHEEKYFDDISLKIESLGKGQKVITGIVDSIGKSTNSNYYLLKNCSIGGMNLGCIRLYFKDDINPYAKIGNFIKVNAGTSTVDSPMNEGEFNQKNYYRSMNIAFIAYAKDFEIVNANYDVVRNKIYEIKELIKNQVKRIFNYKDAGLFTAMITGDRSSIDKEQKKIFSENGIAHIIAISGLHLSILGIALFEFIRRFLSVNVSATIVSIFILLYGIFIDASATSLRAITMLYIRFLSLAIGRTYDSKNTLYIICFIFLMIHPYLLFNAGFQFSYLAIFALNHEVEIPSINYIRAERKKIIHEKISRQTKFIKEIEKRKRYVKLPAVIVLTVFLFPVTVYHYFTYPLYSIFLNLLVIPLMSFVLGFGILALILSFLHIKVGIVIGFIVHIIFAIYDKLCILIDKLPYHLLLLGKPNLYEVMYYYVAIFLIIYAIKYFYIKPRIIKSDIDIVKHLKRKYTKYKFLNIIRLVFCFFLLIFSILILSVRKKNDMRLTFISIGQGDSILLMANDFVMSIDGGSSSNTSNGQYILAPHIKSRAINHIDYAFVTHADSDHTNGLIYLMDSEEDIKIKNLVLPINAMTDSKFNKLKSVASGAGTKVTYLKEEDKLTLPHGISINVLSPDYESIDDEKYDQNELSLTFRLDYNRYSCLFTGDIGKKTMERMINDKYAVENMDVDILKVPHHGSKNSNVKEFFDIVSPTYAVVSYGKNNNYGHPSSETIKSLISSGAKVLKTGEFGQVDIYLDKENIVYNTFIH